MFRLFLILPLIVAVLSLSGATASAFSETPAKVQVHKSCSHSVDKACFSDADWSEEEEVSAKPALTFFDFILVAFTNAATVENTQVVFKAQCSQSWPQDCFSQDLSLRGPPALLV